MSILGYSASYFFPEYWSSTPLYGEKIIPLIDYILSSDYSQSEKIAKAFYIMEDKYKNTSNLPIECIKAIIEESGYSYVLDLLGRDENSIRLLVYLLVLVHQLKGTGKGIEVVLNLLKRNPEPMTLNIIGSITNDGGVISGFTNNDYVYYNNFTLDSDPFEITFPIRTSASFIDEQVIASSGDHGFYIAINNSGNVVLMLGSKGVSEWDISDREAGTSTGVLLPNTNYFLKFSYDKYEYALKVSEDNEKFTSYITINNASPLELHKDRLYLGVYNNSGSIENPFGGYIDLNPFSTDIKNIQIEEWFNTVPVDEENTFRVKTDIDLSVVSSDFFQKFSTFVSKYVYPTLKAFEADLKLQNNVTFLPYVRQRITYVASGDV